MFNFLTESLLQIYKIIQLIFRITQNNIVNPASFMYNG